MRALSIALFRKQVSTQCHINYCCVVAVHMLWEIIAGFPSPPINLHYTSTSFNDYVDVRLDWDPPLNDGGAAITNYFIFVNMSQQVVSINTTTTLTLNSTGQHLIEISAVNECGLMSNNASMIIKFPGILIIVLRLWFSVLWLTWVSLYNTKGVSTRRRRGEGMQLQYRGRNAGGY